MDMGPGGSGGAGGGVLDARELQAVDGRSQLVFVSQTKAIRVRLVGGADWPSRWRAPTSRSPSSTPTARRPGTRRAPPCAPGGPHRRRRHRHLRADRGRHPDHPCAWKLAPATPARSASTSTSPPRAPAALQFTVTYDPAANRYLQRLLEVRVDLFLAGEVDCDLLRAAASNPRGAWLSLPAISPFNEVDNTATAGDSATARPSTSWPRGSTPTARRSPSAASPTSSSRAARSPCPPSP
ncbi:MAG: hypothetical protein R3F43_13330 [bacterium]